MELGTPASSLDVIGLKRSLVRILFVDCFLAEVEHCLSELKKARFVLTADVVVTPEQFAERLRSDPFDVVVAEHPSPNWQGLATCLWRCIEPSMTDCCVSNAIARRKNCGDHRRVIAPWQEI